MESLLCSGGRVDVPIMTIRFFASECSAIGAESVPPNGDGLLLSLKNKEAGGASVQMPELSRGHKRRFIRRPPSGHW